MSNGMFNTCTDAVIHNCEFSGVIIAIWTKGARAKIWNCYMHDLVMRIGPGGADDYGASALTVEAHDVWVEGVTARNAWGSSPDYDQWGGDGSLCDIWNYGNNLHLLYCYVDVSPRVLEGGAMVADASADNCVAQHIYAKLKKDDPFYFNPDGPYAGLGSAENTFVGRNDPTNVITYV